MKNKIRILIFVFLAVLIGIGLIYIRKGGTNTNVLPQKQVQEEIVQANIEVGNTIYKVSLPKGSTVFDLMQYAERQNNFQFYGKDFQGLGFFVSEINGVKQDPLKGSYWIYYINNQKAQVGVSGYIIKNNDTITWKYEKSSD